MAKTKQKQEQLVVARLSLSGSVAYLREEVDKSKKQNKFRGPREVGQRHESIDVVIKVGEGEYKKRVLAAEEILKTGKMPVDDSAKEILKEKKALKNPVVKEVVEEAANKEVLEEEVSDEQTPDETQEPIKEV